MDPKDLKTNPIFAMSLSSKELFHSNFWAWLCDRQDKGLHYIRIFFPGIKGYSSVEREQKHRDVTVWDGNIAYVIENKFKSIPTKEQLLRYQKEIEDSKKEVFGEGILTGIIEPSFIHDPELKAWTFMSYKQIGEEIVKVANSGIETDPFQKDVIVSYGRLIQDLYDLLMDRIRSADSRWILNDQDLVELRIEDIYSKLIASQLVEYLKKHLSIPRTIGDYELVIQSGYGQGGAIADVRYAIIDEALKEKYRKPIKDIYKWNCLGIQIEGDKYRWCASIAKNAKKYSQETDRLFDEVRTTSGWFVEYNYKAKLGEIADHIDGTRKRPTKQAHPKKLTTRKYIHTTYMVDQQATRIPLCINIGH